MGFGFGFGLGIGALGLGLWGWFRRSVVLEKKKKQFLRCVVLCCNTYVHTYISSVYFYFPLKIPTSYSFLIFRKYNA